MSSFVPQVTLLSVLNYTILYVLYLQYIARSQTSRPIGSRAATWTKTPNENGRRWDSVHVPTGTIQPATNAYSNYAVDNRVLKSFLVTLDYRRSAPILLLRARIRRHPVHNGCTVCFAITYPNLHCTSDPVLVSPSRSRRIVVTYLLPP